MAITKKKLREITQEEIQNIFEQPDTLTRLHTLVEAGITMGYSGNKPKGSTGIASSQDTTDYFRSKSQEYEEMSNTTEYAGTSHFIDPQILDPQKIRDSDPRLWKLFGHVWTMMQAKNPTRNDIAKITKSISSERERSRIMDKLGFTPEEKQLIMSAYESAQSLIGQIQ